MIRIWLPADAHRRLLAALPDWTPAHTVLKTATEMHYAVGVRRVTCNVQDAHALLQVAERVYPEAAPLIRIALRKAGASQHAPVSTQPRPRRRREAFPEPPRHTEILRERLVPVHSLASVHVLLFGFQILGFLDRMRDVLRRLF
jgi:hypothetical protein